MATVEPGVTAARPATMGSRPLSFLPPFTKKGREGAPLQLCRNSALPVGPRFFIFVFRTVGPRQYHPYPRYSFRRRTTLSSRETNSAKAPCGLSATWQPASSAQSEIASSERTTCPGTARGENGDWLKRAKRDVPVPVFPSPGALISPKRLEVLLQQVA